MNIKEIVLRRVKMRMKFPFQTSFGTELERHFIIAEVHDGEHIGYGECVVTANPFYSEETVKTAWHLLEDFLIPIVYENNPVSHPDELNGLFRQIRRNNMAKAAIEGAVWDLYAKTEAQPLAKIIGGTKKTIEVGISIGIQPTVDALLERVDGYLEQGYRKIKIKIEPGKDVDMLAAVRKRFGNIPMMADANSAYTLDDIGVFKEMDDLDLMMFEQPLAHDDIVDHAKLQAELKTPICLDESIHSLEDTRKAIELGSARIINIKIGRVGGIAEAVRIHDLCKENGIPVWCGGMLESGIGRAHNIAITSLDNFTIPGDTAPSSRYWDEDIIVPKVKMHADGTIDVPETPGIGYAVNEAALDKYTVEKKVYQKP